MNWYQRDSIIIGMNCGMTVALAGGSHEIVHENDQNRRTHPAVEWKPCSFPGDSVRN